MIEVRVGEKVRVLGRSEYRHSLGVGTVVMISDSRIDVLWACGGVIRSHVRKNIIHAIEAEWIACNLHSQPELQNNEDAIRQNGYRVYGPPPLEDFSRSVYGRRRHGPDDREPILENIGFHPLSGFFYINQIFGFFHEAAD